MSGIRDLLARSSHQRRENRDLGALEAQVERLQLQNERLRSAMRRCLTCDLRLDARAAGTDPDGHAQPDGVEPLAVAVHREESKP